MNSNPVRILASLVLAATITLPSLAKRPGSGGSNVSHTVKQELPI
jgi:hypothetical protein